MVIGLLLIIAALQVLTSFEVVDFLGAYSGLLLLKWMKSQVTTEHYRQHQLYYEWSEL